MFDMKQFYLLRTTIIVKVVVGKNIFYLQVIRYCSVPDVRVLPSQHLLRKKSVKSRTLLAAKFTFYFIVILAGCVSQNRVPHFYAKKYVRLEVTFFTFFSLFSKASAAAHALPDQLQTKTLLRRTLWYRGECRGPIVLQIPDHAKSFP